MSAEDATDSADLTAVGDQLRALVDQALPRLEQMDADRVARPLGEGGWSAQQVLGHMIDSAVVNQQRRVRARLEDGPLFTDYDQNGWVAVQRIDQRPWRDVVELWAALNRHFAHLVASTPPGDADRRCRIEGGDAVSLGYLARDYVAHQRHHLASILGAP